MTRNRGFTLLEVLASVVLLALAIVAVAFALQQTTLFSKDNENVDRSVQITRIAMEEIKNKLKTYDTVTVFDQTIDLEALRENAPPYPVLPIELYYPSADNPQYTLSVSSLAIADPSIVTGSTTLNLQNYFRLIKIVTVHMSDNRTYELESYVDYA